MTTGYFLRGLALLCAASLSLMSWTIACVKVGEYSKVFRASSNSFNSTSSTRKLTSFVFTSDLGFATSKTIHIFAPFGYNLLAHIQHHTVSYATVGANINPGVNSMPTRNRTRKPKRTLVGGGKQSLGIRLSLGLVRRMENYVSMTRRFCRYSGIINAALVEFLDKHGVPQADPDVMTVEELFPGEPRCGFVYLFRGQGALCDGLHKIGRARNVASRAKGICRADASAVSVVHQIPVPDTVVAEKAAHGLFRERRVYGEWHRLTPADVRKFKKLTAADLCPKGVA